MLWCWNCKRGKDEDSLSEAEEQDGPVTEQPVLRLPRALLRRSGPNLTQSMIELSQQCSIVSQEGYVTICSPQEMKMYDTDGKPIFYVSSRDLVDIDCKLGVNLPKEESVDEAMEVTENGKANAGTDGPCQVSVGEAAKCFVVKSVQTVADGNAKHDAKQSLVYFVKEGRSYVRKFEVSWCDSSAPTEKASTSVDPGKDILITNAVRAHSYPLNPSLSLEKAQVPLQLKSKTFHLRETQAMRTHLRRSLSESCLQGKTRTPRSATQPAK